MLKHIAHYMPIALGKGLVESTASLATLVQYA